MAETFVKDILKNDWFSIMDLEGKKVEVNWIPDTLDVDVDPISGEVKFKHKAFPYGVLKVSSADCLNKTPQDLGVESMMA